MKEDDYSGNSNSAIDFLGNEWSFECMGCAIANGELRVPGGILYEGEHVVLVADCLIPVPGFLIVQMKRHARSLTELSAEERKEVGDVLVCAKRALKDLGIAGEVTLVQEELSEHFHFWVFPTHEWMEDKFGSGVKHLNDIITYAKNNVSENDKKEIVVVADRVREYFKKHFPVD